MTKKEYTVKIEVTETHVAFVEASSVEEAREIALSNGVNSSDALFKTTTILKEQAVDSCPDGWSCAHCGDEYSEKTVNVEDYYVLITDEGTLCLKCYELENSTIT